MSAQHIRWLPAPEEGFIVYKIYRCTCDAQVWGFTCEANHTGIVQTKCACMPEPRTAPSCACGFVVSVSRFERPSPRPPLVELIRADRSEFRCLASFGSTRIELACDTGRVANVLSDISRGGDRYLLGSTLGVNISERWDSRDRTLQCVEIRPGSYRNAFLAAVEPAVWDQVMGDVASLIKAKFGELQR